MTKMKVFNVFFVASLALLFHAICTPIPVQENDLRISGIVTEICIVSSAAIGIQPEQPIFKLQILLDTVEVIQPPNFLQDKLGETVILLSKETIPQELFGKRINLRVQYRGGEKRGDFWIKQILGAE